jgi:four helix bundle protein
MKFLGTLPKVREYDVYKYQLSKAVHSIGANYDESQGAYSKADFAAKIGICLKEARETNYFFIVLNQLQQSGELTHLLRESDEIKKIFGSIMVKLRRKN